MSIVEEKKKKRKKTPRNMDKKQFVDLVNNPAQYSSQDRGWLKAMQAKYPFSSVVTLQALLADHVFGFDTPEGRRSVALAMCDPSVMDGLLANASQRTAPAEDSSFDILNEINTFQEISFKTAPKSVILSNFLKVDPSAEEKMSNKEASTHDINDKKSLQANESLGTETLAVILEKQGNYAQALAIYKNLLARNPEKSSIFAPRIEKLESLLNRK